MSQPNIENLRWIRLFHPVHIPKYLVEQVRDRDYTVEDFYKYQETACAVSTEHGPRLNPLNHLYVLAKEDNLIKGFLWFTVDPLSKNIFVHTYSVDKEYWGNGKAVKKLVEFVGEIRKKASLNKVYWTTNYPKHSERYGFKRSRSILVEYSEKENGEDAHRRNGTRREHQPSDTGTTTISEHDRDTRCCGGSAECVSAVPSTCNA